ncbi:hypothetical protein AQUSIP_12550 [Aquicella siphonis]|uniref:Uncharacterized protein n=1 Tax=Aquicella siphonis TaxID=254247 RepID=A0A5E4PGF9_9COXI|nr:hypothetical protein [Aquicella siphonis]VVC75954.1 hypothetical protein AQUSIP_12550 [Aquicella siphonis]
MTEHKIKEAWLAGKIYTAIKMAKDDLVMDKPKDALNKLNEALKIFDAEIASEYNKPNNEVNENAVQALF